MAILSDFDPAMKQLYKPALVENLTYKKHPMFGLLTKKEDFVGRNMPIPLQYGNTQGRSATFSTAQSNVTNAKWEDFLLTRVNDHSIAHIDGETAEASMSDKGAFLKHMKNATDSAMASLANAIESALPRSGSGAIGQVASGATVSSQVIALEDVEDIVNFEAGMTLVAAATETGSVRSGTEVIAKVDRRDGEVTATSAAWNTVITALAASDYLFVEGDAQNGGSANKISGFASWWPETEPTGSDSFFSVNRSVDSRLYGGYHDGSAQKVEEALIDAQSKVAREEGAPDICIISHKAHRKLAKELGSKKDYSETNAVGSKGMLANVSYTGFLVHGNHGDMRIIAASKCQSDRGWMFEKGAVGLASIGKATKFNDLDGNRVLRRASADGVEARIVFRGNFYCNAPKYCSQVKLAV